MQSDNETFLRLALTQIAALHAALTERPPGRKAKASRAMKGKWAEIKASAATNAVDPVMTVPGEKLEELRRYWNGA
jgi:hypothetical protein